jgi:hypothetical protein
VLPPSPPPPPPPPPPNPLPREDVVSYMSMPPLTAMTAPLM